MRSEEMQMKAKEDHHWAENQNEKREREKVNGQFNNLMRC